MSVCLSFCPPPPCVGAEGLKTGQKPPKLRPQVSMNRVFNTYITVMLMTHSICKLVIVNHSSIVQQKDSVPATRK